MTTNQMILTAELDEAVRGAKEAVFTTTNRVSLDKHLRLAAVSAARLEKAKAKRIVYRGV